MRTRAATALLLALASASYAQDGRSSSGTAAAPPAALSFELVDQEFPVASYNEIASGDIDGDGAPDVFAATNNWPGGDGRPRLWLDRTRRR